MRQVGGRRRARPETRKGGGNELQLARGGLCQRVSRPSHPPRFSRHAPFTPLPRRHGSATTSLSRLRAGARPARTRAGVGGGDVRPCGAARGTAHGGPGGATPRALCRGPGCGATRGRRNGCGIRRPARRPGLEGRRGVPRI